MKISKDDLLWVAKQEIISEGQAFQIWEALNARKQHAPKFDIVHVAYYFGAFIIMAAMGWFMNDAWNRFGGSALTVVAVIYGSGFIFAGRRFWFRDGLKVPGGLCFALAVWITPLAIFGIEKELGWWAQGDPGTYRDYYQWIKGGWCFMEIGTIIAGIIALKFIKFPFLTFPIAFALWFMSMDLTPILFGGDEYVTWDTRKFVSIFFGIIVLIASYFVDRRTKEDYAFWGYLFGMLAFWGGLTLLESGSELNKFFYCLINIGLVLVSVLFQRKVFIVFGAMGVFGYIGHLSLRVFKDSVLFPVALCIIGCLIMFFGIQYQRHYRAIEIKLAQSIPAGLKRLLPPHRS
jgi:hypothetical protein